MTHPDKSRPSQKTVTKSRSEGLSDVLSEAEQAVVNTLETPPTDRDIQNMLLNEGIGPSPSIPSNINTQPQSQPPQIPVVERALTETLNVGYTKTSDNFRDKLEMEFTHVTEKMAEVKKQIDALQDQYNDLGLKAGMIQQALKYKG